MTSRVYAGVGISADGKTLDSSNLGVSHCTATLNGAEFSAELRAGKNITRQEAVETLTRVAGQHAIPTEAMREIIEATLAAYGSRRGTHAMDQQQDRKTDSSAVRMEQLERDLSEKDTPNASQPEQKRDSKLYVEDRTNLIRVWRFIKDAPESHWTNQGTSKVRELQKLAQSWRNAYATYERISAEMLEDHGRMQKAIAEVKPSPWYAFVLRVASAFLPNRKSDLNPTVWQKVQSNTDPATERDERATKAA